MDIAEHFPSEDLDAGEFEDYPHHLTNDEAQELANRYSADDARMSVVEEEYYLSHDEFLDFRRVHELRHGQPTAVHPQLSIEEAVGHLTQRQKQQATERAAKQEIRRERQKAAEKWWDLEDSMMRALEDFQAQEYEPPQLRVRLSESPATQACGVANFQDLHLGVRPTDAEGFRVEEYREEILRRIETTLEDATRLRQIERLYLLGGGDLVHADTAGGTTASGTQLEMACSTSQALQHGIRLLVEAVDMARQVAEEVVIVPVHGNHDRTQGVAAALACAHHFNDAEDVRAMDMGERQYATYGEHLFCMTHGDLSKRRMRKMGEVIRSEARDKISETAHTSLFTGHLHHKAMDMIDESGRVHYQAPSPIPEDAYHEQSGYVGSRKGVQLVLFDREGSSDRLIHA